MSMNNHLYRSRDDRMLAGVAGGLAELWDADPSLVRIVWAVLVVLTGGIALVVYIVMALVVPEDDGTTAWNTYVGWPGTSGPPPVPGSAPTPSAAAPTGGDPAAAASGPVSGPASGQPAPGPSAPLPGWPVSRFEARQMRRAARWEARAARREARLHGDHPGAIIVGVLFVLVGLWYLVKEYLPTVDWDWFWPIILIGLGVLVLFLAVRPQPDDRHPNDPGPSGGAS
jgi:phage shock protein C